MSTLSVRPLLPMFLPSLNALLATLALPFTLDHPSDLTPSLLLAIFESLINARLPIPNSVRQSRTRDAKARAMLVLLGVLECDVLRGGTTADTEHSIATSNADDSGLGGAGGVSVDGWVDEIGLGEVDPERLADGGWEETIFVGELLCWLARRKGILPRTKSSHRTSHRRSLYLNHHSYGTEGEGEGDTADFSTSLLLQPSTAQKMRSPRPPSSYPSMDNLDADVDSSILSHITDVPRHPLVHSPEPSLSVSVTTGTDLSIRARSVSSRTSVSNAHNDSDEVEEALQDTIQTYDPRHMMQDAEEDDDRPPRFRAWCIHELEDPSYIRALAGPSSSFDASVSHSRVSEDSEDEPSRDEDDHADEQDNEDPYAPSTPTPRRVRLTGWIDPVDPASELSHFAATRTHSRLHTFDEGAGSASGPPSRLPSQPYKHARTGEVSKSILRLKTEPSPRPRPSSGKQLTPRRAPPSPSPSPPHPSSISPPSPPSPVIHSDPPFDVSFSTLNNTSTPAKPRLPRRPQFQMMIHHGIASDACAGADRGKNGASVTTTTATGTGRPRRDRSPSYTPSPPSFSTPGSLRNGGARVGRTSGTMVSSTGSSGTRTRVIASASPGLPPLATMTTTKNKNSRDSSPSPMVKGKSPSPVAPPGSTAMTNTLLTERARLLTELAALKRARATSTSRMETGAMSGVGMGTRMGGSDAVVGRRVGVGV